MTKLLDNLDLLVQNKTIAEAHSTMEIHSCEWIGQVDGYERSIVHLAVENGKSNFLEALLLAGEFL